MVVSSKASEAWKFLNGVFCVYKPPDLSVHRLRQIVLGNLCRDLNQMEGREPGKYVVIEESHPKQYDVIVRENYAENPLIFGSRYQPEDIRLTWATFLGRKTSGVLMMGVNEGTKQAYKLHQTRPTRTYHVSGVLGKVSDNLYIDGKILDKASFDHVKRSTVDRALSAIQAAHQRAMFNQSKLDIQSQAAYELAIQGPIRPSDGTLPVVYSIKCIYFEPPDFTLEIQSINEYESYLISFIHELGLKLRTLATCTGVRCIRHSHFTLEDALLRKHWSLQYIINNIIQCSEVIQKQKLLTPALENAAVT